MENHSLLAKNLELIGMTFVLRLMCCPIYFHSVMIASCRGALAKPSNFRMAQPSTVLFFKQYH